MQYYTLFHYRKVAGVEPVLKLEETSGLEIEGDMKTWNWTVVWKWKTSAISRVMGDIFMLYIHLLYTNALYNNIIILFNIIQANILPHYPSRQLNFTQVEAVLRSHNHRRVVSKASDVIGISLTQGVNVLWLTLWRTHCINLRNKRML